MTTARVYENAGDLRRMQDVVSASWHTEKPLVRFHVGDLAWARYQHAGREDEWRIRLWDDANGRPVGWAWLFLPDEAVFHVVPELRRELTQELIAWLWDTATGSHGATRLNASVLEQDELTVRSLLAEGFRIDGDAPAFDAMVLELNRGLPHPRLPAGFRTRHVEGEADLARRVAVHRAAWSVFGPSRLTEESFANVMAAWPYTPELDWVVEAPDGRFVSSCLAWYDEANRVGELEPVGTDPAFWRRGFGFAACAAALRALRARGADTAIVYARNVSGKPSAPALYRRLGFETRGRHVTFTRRLAESRVELEVVERPGVDRPVAEAP